MGYKKFLRDTLFFVNKNPVSKFIYEQELSKRSKMALTDIVPLSKQIQLFSPYTNEINTPNDWYGHAKIFKKFLGLPDNYQFKFIIEHGLHLTEGIFNIEFESGLSSCITHSKFRANIVKNHCKRVFYIGPFIHYAQSFYSKEKIASEKKRLGKNIILFPGHSVNYLIIKHDNNWFLKKVKEISKDYNNIRICLYWADIQQGFHKYYQDLGFECVTAGHILDPLFLPRLKSIIEISDLTISNDAATHVSYCIYLNKPHIIFYKPPKIQANKEWSDFAQKYRTSKTYAEIINAFSGINFKITAKQKQVANDYFGLNAIKSKEEFRKIVDLTEKIYQRQTD